MRRPFADDFERCPIRQDRHLRVGGVGQHGAPNAPKRRIRETDLRRAKARGATVLAHRLRLYLALHEGADALDGRSRFRKDPRPDLPGVRHSRPYFEFDLTSGGAHPLRHAHGIIEEDLVAADLDERRRTAARQTWRDREF